MKWESVIHFLSRQEYELYPLFCFSSFWINITPLTSQTFLLISEWMIFSEVFSCKIFTRQNCYLRRKWGRTKQDAVFRQAAETLPALCCWAYQMVWTSFSLAPFVVPTKNASRNFSGAKRYSLLINSKDEQRNLKWGIFSKFGELSFGFIA